MLDICLFPELRESIAVALVWLQLVSSEMYSLKEMTQSFFYI